MVEGINMGRKSPWTKEEYVSVYNNVTNYAQKLSVQLLSEEGIKSAAEAIAAYNIYKCPAIYLYIHYHYGKFEDLGMSNEEVSVYLTMFLPNVMYFSKELKKAYSTGNIFLDISGEALSKTLIEMCEEIIYIEENF